MKTKELAVELKELADEVQVKLYKLSPRLCEMTYYTIGHLEATSVHEELENHE